MKIESWLIGRPLPYGKNPRKNKAAVAKVRASIEEFGFRQPIVVDAKGVIVVGHTRLIAAQELGLTEVPVHVAEDLTPSQARAYRIADNRTNQDAEWDLGLLAEEIIAMIGEGTDLLLTGFDQPELNEILAKAAANEKGLVAEDEVPEVPKEPVSKHGDIYQLGKHRVICGDSTDPSQVAALVSGAAIEMLWTDPPYGVSYVGKTKDALTIKNDGAEGIEDLLTRSFSAADSVMAPGARVYLATPPGPNNLTFRVAFLSAGWKFHEGLVWVKNTMVLGHSDYHLKHEDILYGWKPGEGRVGRGNHEGSRWYGDHAQVSVFEYDKPSRSADHPTMKPPELIRRCIENSTKAPDAVLDLFGGSGSTLIACEQTGRIAYLMEIDPRYCDVIVRRWEEFTGQTATKIS